MPPTPHIAPAGATTTEAHTMLTFGFEQGQNQAVAQVLKNAEGLEGIPFLILNGQAVSLKQFMPPRLGDLDPRFTDADSIIAYIKKYALTDTAIFAEFEEDGGEFTVVFDYPAPGQVSRREHVARFKVEPTAIWTDWLSKNKEWMNQDDFAEFIERYKKGVFLNPSGAEMTDISRYIEGKKEGAFKFGTRRSNGDREILWQEQTQINAGTAGGEATTIPEELEVALPLFEGTQPTDLSAWFRVRVQGGKCVFQYEIQNLENIVRQSLNSMKDKIAAETGIGVYLGTADLTVQ